MNLLMKSRILFRNVILILVLSVSFNAFGDEDKRTPLQKYQGAYTGAYLLCVLQQKQLFLLEKAKQKGVTLDPEFGKEVDMEACKQKGLAEMKKEYTN